MASAKDSTFVSLVSCDGFEYILPYETACVSGTIRRMLDPTSNFAESRSGRCVLEEIDGVVLEQVCKYLVYNYRAKHMTNVPDMDVPAELCLELVMAADYLDV
ncbi:elongin-C [Penicillium herquei]|nr:elongin-C [Penicillium herquei]KAJ5718418.1 elongin-C [Penicillium malachiteum]